MCIYTQDSLLSEEERALYELDQPFLHDVTTAREEQDALNYTHLRDCFHKCRVCCCYDKGLLSLAAMLLLTVIGVVILVVTKVRDISGSVEELGRYFLSAGVFGLASGGTNWLAVVGLFFKVPGFIGSG